MSIKITPHKLGGSFIANTPGVVLQTLVAPASNTNGIRINAVWIYHAPAPGGRLMSKSSAPLAWDDATAKTIACGANETTYASQYFSGGVGLPVIVPPGDGLYYQGSGAGASYLNVNAEVL